MDSRKSTSKLENTIEVDNLDMKDKENELFLIAGDLNISCITFENKKMPKKDFYKKEVTKEAIEYYSQRGELNTTNEFISSYLKLGSRYGLMMALLNSGRLKFFDLQQEIKNDFFITFGEAFYNEETGEVYSKDKVLYGEYGRFAQDGLDYMMVAKPKSKEVSNSLIEIQDIKKEEFFIDNKPYAHLSDHFAIDLLLRINF